MSMQLSSAAYASARRITAREFKKEFDVEILPGGTDVHLGRLMWDPDLGPPTFNFGGAHNILEEFRKYGIIDADTVIRKLDEYKENKVVAAGFPNMAVEFSTSTAAKLNLGDLARISTQFDFTRVSNFSIVTNGARVFTPMQRMELTDWIDDFRRMNWGNYKASVRNLVMIYEAFYGSVEISIDKSTEVDTSFKTTIQGLGIEPQFTFETDRKITYVFASEDVPFAARLKQVKFM